ncbi:MAG: flagellar protein FliS [Ignavibacteriales bacterium]|nr:flagellar protein FliS [Ignavibacteriota bacterium]MCB9248083.1 flagellar protein FliS [Ignavibacteriales bacterium]
MYYSNAVLRTTESYNNNRANAYVVNEIMNATPQQLLIKVYDFAIAQCKKKNIEKTNKALTELISALRYDTKEVNEISNGLKRLYEFCQDQIRLSNFDVVDNILSELRKTWIGAFNNRES